MQDAEKKAQFKPQPAIEDIDGKPQISSRTLAKMLGIPHLQMQELIERQRRIVSEARII